MATNLALPDELINQALTLSGKKTKKKAVTEALQEYVQRRQQQEVLSLFGKVEFDSDYDYKKHRST